MTPAQTGPVSHLNRKYIPFEAGSDPQAYIPAFLKREIERAIIRWRDRPQIGYEILPNKYFYRYTPPPPATDLLKQFCTLEMKSRFNGVMLANRCRWYCCQGTDFRGRLS